MSEAEKSETVILCEGFYDRAFWQGWLGHLGCTVPDPTPGKNAPDAIQDPWGKPVDRGQYAYNSASGKFIRVVPCDGKNNITRQARLRLDRRVNQRLQCLILNVDVDTNADGTPSVSNTLNRAAIEGLARRADPQMTRLSENVLAIDDGATEIALIRWEVGDAPTPGLPNQQTLERLVCASMVAAYPERGGCVHNWLASRHQPPPEGVKEFAWSYMAGWHAENGCNDFYRDLWDDADIQSELEKRLRVSGTWQIVENLTR